ncbi:MAG: flagellar hook-basal body complex protein, partial [Deltaproteobacteria bacterium]|nr:flagellar hook-basal body complex protein [Deltaproteobacteria bacterium]
ASAQTIAAADVNFTGSTQFAAPSQVSVLSQNGSPSGSLSGVRINERGVIYGEFSSGALLPLAQIALANFPNEEGLEPLGDSLFGLSGASGEAQIGAPGAGGLGRLYSGGLEMSTVDLAREFVGMISIQRAFQVNSRVVTVADQMYDEAVNLKT